MRLSSLASCSARGQVGARMALNSDTDLGVLAPEVAPTAPACTTAAAPTHTPYRLHRPPATHPPSTHPPLHAEGAVFAAWHQETPVAVKRTTSLMEVEMSVHAGWHDNIGEAGRGVCTTTSVRQVCVGGGGRGDGTTTPVRPVWGCACPPPQHPSAYTCALRPAVPSPHLQWACGGCARAAAACTW